MPACVCRKQIMAPDFARWVQLPSGHRDNRFDNLKMCKPKTLVCTQYSERNWCLEYAATNKELSYGMSIWQLHDISHFHNGVPSVMCSAWVCTVWYIHTYVSKEQAASVFSAGNHLQDSIRCKREAAPPELLACTLHVLYTLKRTEGWCHFVGSFKRP